MIIVLLLFFKSICLYCQRLVLHIHDRWINPKNVRLLKEAAEAKGAKFQIDDYRQSKKSKKRRYSTSYASPSSGSSPLFSALGNRAESCRFCANTPQGYCRHHFHLQELQVHKQQQKIWCPLGGGFSTRSAEYKQLRKIKRELKRTLELQQKSFDYNKAPNTSIAYQSVPLEEPIYEANSLDSTYQDSGYCTTSLTDKSTHFAEEGGEQPVPIKSEFQQSLSYEYLDLPTPASVVETTYSFESCCETPPSAASPVLPRATSDHSFLSCEETSSISTSHI